METHYILGSLVPKINHLLVHNVWPPSNSVSYIVNVPKDARMALLHHTVPGLFFKLTEMSYISVPVGNIKMIAKVCKRPTIYFRRGF